MTLAINIAAFQAGWFACVLGAANGLPWLGVLVTVPVVAMHLWHSPDAGPELRLLLAAALLGTAWDSTLVALGLLSYPNGQLAAFLAPVWITALWVGFATSLNVSMRWLRGRLWLAALLGGVFGPISFLGGERLGAVSFPEPLLGVTVLAAGWAVLMPLVVVLAGRFDGWLPAEAPAR